MLSVEAVLKSNSLCDNVCVVARPREQFTIAIVVPDKPGLDTLAKSLGLSLTEDGPDFQDDELAYENVRLRQEVASRLYEFGLKNGLVKFEVPRAVVLAREDWTPESGLVTAAMKIRRKQIEDKYSAKISIAYTETEKRGGLLAKSPSSLSSN